MTFIPEEKDRLFDVLDKIANGLTRQAEVMERDVEAEALPKTTEQALEKQFQSINSQYIIYIHELGVLLEDIMIKGYHNNMERAKAIRGFQQQLVKFGGIKIEENF